MATSPDLHHVITSNRHVEARTETVRIVEYSNFPRRVSESALRVGFTRNISKSGVCLGADRPEPVGSMLKLGIRALDGGHVDSRIGRVAWTGDAGDGRHWIGVELLTEASSFASAQPIARLLDGSSGPRRRRN